MSIKKLNNVQLVREYEKLVDERKEINRRIKHAKEALEDRIVKSECKQITTPTKRITIQYSAGDRMKPIKELEAEFGEAWVDEHRRRIQKTVESKKLKIEPLE
tara:strand:- start:1273 stop:1581 length:309 start_codon:yes stop_codon:yes gene_type:complete